MELLRTDREGDLATLASGEDGEGDLASGEEDGEGDLAGEGLADLSIGSKLLSELRDILLLSTLSRSDLEKPIRPSGKARG